VDPDPGDDDDPVTQNGYTYADNNPVMGVDPDGPLPWLAINAGFAAYDGYKAYKSGASWKRVGMASARGFVGGKQLEILHGQGSMQKLQYLRLKDSHVIFLLKLEKL